MSTQQTSVTRYIDVLGVKTAYRHFGSKAGVPLLFNQHFRGTMDHWDPLLINTIAEKRPVILFDSHGVGKSSGEIPATFSAWATVAASLVKALGIEKVDVFGFSMGGMVAQMIGLNFPEITRRLIIGGSSPSYGEGIVSGPEWPFVMLLNASTSQEAEEAFIKTFYSQSEAKIAKGKAWWKRMNERTEDRSPYLNKKGSLRQAAAVGAWFTPGPNPDNSYDRLGGVEDAGHGGEWG
ncbi:Alpha/Beta hydrolase protein [Lipomyces orientalis]|uniref:Alpha/Beta hydrolase protein n=1 Tax=Lipomyces orientalis TaxID=1233043 RepID=A0ACC3TFF3_9ASCO